MDVFISWSGEHSRAIATELRKWLPRVIQAINPYMSDRDNEAGGRWNLDVSQRLEASGFGILCLTPDNLDSKWLHFEAGALGKSVEEGRVIPLLFGVTPANVQGPLSQFMMKQVDESGIRDVLKAMNASLVDPLEDAEVQEMFALIWPRLKSRLEEIRVESAHRLTREKPQRPDRELLEEMLQIVRGLRGAARDLTQAEGHTTVKGRATGIGGPANISGSGTLTATSSQPSNLSTKELEALRGTDLP